MKVKISGYQQEQSWRHEKIFFIWCAVDVVDKRFEGINTKSMKSYCIIYFEHRNDVTYIIKLCLENKSRRRVFSVKLDYACDVISMFKINYTTAFHGKVFYNIPDKK